MRDVRLGPHRVHRDQRAFQIEMFEQQRDRGDFIRFLFGRLLAQYDSLPCPLRWHSIGYADGTLATVAQAETRCKGLRPLRQGNRVNEYVTNG